MNCKNANKELGFDIFSECDYNLHWSFSNFNRMLMAAGQIARLPIKAKVLELGAGSSNLENIVKNNFRRQDISFIKIDGDKEYEKSENVKVMDITSKECDDYCKANGKFDAVVIMEVVEHLHAIKDVYELILEKITNWLKDEGMLILTTPTPPMDKKYEQGVWPTDHDFEYSYTEIYTIINVGFKVVKEIGWSLEEREYNKLLEENANLSLMESKLKGAFPDSFIRAIIASFAPVEMNRQIMFICKKRRKNNGRFTQA